MCSEQIGAIHCFEKFITHSVKSTNITKVCIKPYLSKLQMCFHPECIFQKNNNSFLILELLCLKLDKEKIGLYSYSQWGIHIFSWLALVSSQTVFDKNQNHARRIYFHAPFKPSIIYEQQSLFQTTFHSLRKKNNYDLPPDLGQTLFESCEVLR